MLGLSLEKLIVIGIVAAVVIGPERLPQYASKLAGFVRSFRDFTAATKAKAESDLGVPLDTAEWNRQIRRYDPRVIVRDALKDDALKDDAPQDAPAVVGTDTASVSEPDTAPEQDVTPEPEPVMRERWIVVGGTSGHPVRRRVLEPVAATVQATVTDAVPDAAPEDPESDVSDDIRQ
ncbi:Sec-independent protein translocase subunit TatA/TatB [Corynebacterium neomassiliense]|uniref:Sec-independent protein translocase subunit TatA/TatB n=1 Tax=Corynebacterium neomassiliense TaxID=2079482 RepID=UPI0010307907|nr:twin-arginine translocase TatA/TatE family subunit [Corynebacterium neomassiliense]